MNANPRIAIVIPTPGNYSETFINAHRQQLRDVVCVLVEGLLPQRLASGARFMRPSVAGRGWDVLAAALRGTDLKGLLERRLAKQLQRDRVDVLLVEYGNAGEAMINSSRRARVPMVVHFHGFDAHRVDTLQEMGKYQRLFAHASAIVVVSRAMEAHLVGLGAPSEKVVYNACGVDLDQFSAGHPEHAPPHFVTVGRFVNKKAPHLALAAFRLVLEQRPEARLTMVGTGPLHESCAHLVTAFGLSDRVQLMGVRTPEEVAALLHGARGFIQHSVRTANGDSEGTPVAVLEALASGVPVIATRHAGIIDVVTHEESGLLCDEFDVRAMAGHLVRLIDDSALSIFI